MKDATGASIDILNSVVHILSLALMFILVITIVVFSLMYYFTDGNKNVKKKKIYLSLLIAAVSVLYLIRFGLIFVLSSLNSINVSHIGHSGSIFVSILRFVQLMVLAILPTYSIIQSYIFEYQTIIKNDSVESNATAKKWRHRGIISSIVLVILLQIVINLF